MRTARTIRKLREKSLTDIENDVGIDRGSMSKFEHGQVSLREKNLVALAKYLDTSVDELLREEKAPAPRSRKAVVARG